jgi:hypothetical protein
MKTNRLLVIYITSLLFLFILGCQKDNHKPDETDQIKKLTTSSRTSLGDNYLNGVNNEATESEMDLKYDKENKLLEIGLFKFIYGANGRVEKKVFINQDPNFPYEEIFEWDQLGRLKEVKVSSANQSIEFTTEDGEISNSLIIAKFEYNSTEKKPSRIYYRDRLSFSDSKFSKFMSISYKYQGDDISECLIEDINIPLLNPYHFMYIDIKVFYKNGNTKHYLKNIYDQIGFNPITIYEVIPEHLPEKDIAILVQDNNSDPNLDWNDASTYTVEKDNRSRPIGVYKKTMILNPNNGNLLFQEESKSIIDYN